MSTHTPGPWAAVEEINGGHPLVVTYRDHQDPKDWVPQNYSATIASSIGDFTEKRTSGNEWANAHLIAAAPDMFEALDHISGLSRALRAGGPDPMDLQGLSDALEEAVNMACEVLAKARGES